MKKDTSISSLLGVTQNEMALLLSVSRSQWSMFELGLGNLPSRATHLLAELLTYTKASQKISNRRLQTTQQKVSKPQLERLLFENAYQQSQTDRKVSIAEKKYAAQMRMLPLISVLNKPDTQRSATAQNLLLFVNKKTSELKAAKALQNLIQLRIKQKVLVYEKQLLQEGFVL